MSDKSRAYSDSAGTLIIKGSSMAEIQAFMQEACGMAEELRKAHAEIADLQRQNALLHAEFLGLRGVVSP